MSFRFVEKDTLLAECSASSLVGLVKAVVVWVGGREWLDGKLSKMVKSLAQVSIIGRFSRWYGVSGGDLKRGA